MKTIFITGYMASGKSTLARALARLLGCEFIDLDFYIEQRYRKSVKELFAERGEEGFREIERNMLHEAGEFENVVIACGGGTPCHFDNMEYMKSRGITVWLRASEECTVERMLRLPGRRPLVAGKSRAELLEYVHAHMAERQPCYARAHIAFDGEHLENRRDIARSAESLATILTDWL